MVKMSLSSQQSKRLFDYFFICGLNFTSGLEPDNLARDVQFNPLERAYKCHILEHYPNSAAWNPFDQNALCMLCLPHGLQFRTQKNLVEPKFHSFVITREDGSRYYGFSLLFFEEVRNVKISNAIQDLQAMHLAELSNAGKSPVHNSRSLPRHFKLSTHQPHSAQNYYDSSKDTLYVSKCIALVSQSPYVAVSEAFLRKLQSYAMTKPAPGQLSVESYVYNFLYEVPVPRPGRSIQVQIVNNGKMVIQRPITIEELPLLDFSMETLFSLLTLDHVIQLYTCILLENQVLISSKDYQKLMLVAECMSSLLFPFIWQHVYVPILPASLQHFLDAPVPFIMGLPTQESQVPVASEADLCYLNIDSGVMQIPEERPSFPRKREFVQRLESLLVRFGVTCRYDHHQNDLMSSSVVVPGGHFEPLRRKHSWSHDANEQRLMIQIDRPNGGDGDLKSESEDMKSEALNAVEQYLRQLTFNNAIRETFLNNFVRIFADYHQFVIMPKEDEKEEWFRNRETMANFDKATFLSDQPQQDLPFLSQFLETQMFASLIDTKILAQSNEVDHNLRVFDKRIKNLRRRNNIDDGTDACDIAIRESQRLIEKRFFDVSENVPLPRELLPTPSDHFRLKKTPKTFPSLDGNVLNKEPARRPGRVNTNSQWSGQRKVRRDGGSTERGSHNTRASLAHSPARIAQANWNFVETLLKDCKSKTNRMVVEKMGAEGVMLGEQIGNIEENTLIASFCDHLEKVWSHGMQQKQGKSALWSHLIRFKDGDAEGLSEGVDTLLTVSPDLSSLAQDLDLPSRSGEPSPCTTPDSRSLERRGSGVKSGEYPSLKPLPVSVSFDVRNIEAMTEIKSEIGFSRAWIRLSLEKKLLSKHLTSLLADSALLKSQYKRNAFLRCEDEREQFLFHLLSLNAVDYFCFTNTYITAKLPYRVMIVPFRRTHVSSTTANAWIAVSGTLGESCQISVPKGAADFLFHHKNLGLLTTLRIGHDNSGLSPNWYVDTVIVRCEVTAHTYRFPCGRYLGRRLEDGSTERLLVGERVKAPHTEDREVFTPSPRSPVAARRQPHRSVAELQHMIGDAVNNIVKLFYRGGQTRSRGTLTPLLCGEMGLVDSLYHSFLYGFKASRLFSRNLYLWDFFLRVKEAHENVRRTRECGSLDRRKHNRLNNNECDERRYGHERAGTPDRTEANARWGTADGRIPRANYANPCQSTSNYHLSLQRGRPGLAGRRCSDAVDSAHDAMARFCELVGKVENSSRSFGKDGKFQQFICLSLRERILHSLLHPLAASRPALEMYEEYSFLRDPTLRNFLVDILASLSEFDFSLEASITSGID